MRRPGSCYRPPVNSMRARLYALWFLLVGSAVATGVLLYQFYAQSAAVQLARSEVEVGRSCRDIADRYAFFVAGWSGPEATVIDERLRRDLAGVVAAALLRATGTEGGLWSGDAGSLAYAFPTYEGSGPKTDLPAAELSSISQVNAEAVRDGQARTASRPGREQTLILQACPVAGPIRNVTAWAMTRVFTGRGPAYNQLLLGLGLLTFSVLGSALFLGHIILTYARRIGGLERALAAHDGYGSLPELASTGERELDRLVGALNRAGGRLTDARARLVSAERLAAFGAMAAGVAHEIRNPMAAMRLKAENALASGEPDRARSALSAILEQVDRLNGLLGDLLGLTQPRAPNREPTDVGRLVTDAVRLHAETAQLEGIDVTIVSGPLPEDRPVLDAEQVGRAVSNLLLNALQSLAGTPGGSVTITTERLHAADGDRLRITVADTGPGVVVELRERIFEPFETSRPGGSGLGLSIVREIARAHGGCVRLVPGRSGGAFELDLPWRPS